MIDQDDEKKHEKMQNNTDKFANYNFKWVVSKTPVFEGKMTDYQSTALQNVNFHWKNNM